MTITTAQKIKRKKMYKKKKKRKSKIKSTNEKMIKTHSDEDRQSLLETGWENTKNQK